MSLFSRAGAWLVGLQSGLWRQDRILEITENYSAFGSVNESLPGPRLTVLILDLQFWCVGPEMSPRSLSNERRGQRATRSVSSRAWRQVRDGWLPFAAMRALVRSPIAEADSLACHDHLCRALQRDGRHRDQRCERRKDRLDANRNRISWTQRARRARRTCCRSDVDS
jgi:hypothetical protein